ncbi:hypothetical protein [Bradyrhizobium sp. SRS-191]|uniref:hypothetical protein n=1 Tax=Bradyrhizobium sp. SRS-191 TaxID=2962606 RepID=UPI00211E44BB|nr:hypothetical protein [Bradyrhizobium sp. SRS-191]
MMAVERADVGGQAMARLEAAAVDFARAEIERIVESVIDDLRSRPAFGTFGDVAARQLWDEYCWFLQKGPFDDDLSWDSVRLGSLSTAYEDAVRAAIQAEVEKLPRYALLFLNLEAIEGAAYGEEDIGRAWDSIVVSRILNDVNARASNRILDLIGPDREDVLCYQIEGAGEVWSILSDRGEVMDIIARHSDALLDPKGDVSELAQEMVEAFMAAAADDDEGALARKLLERFGDEVRSLVRDKDVVPSLMSMRAVLLDRLDR